MPHGLSGVTGSYKYSSSAEVDACIIFCVHLWNYILHTCMCVVLMLVLWHPACVSSTLVYGLECLNIFMLFYSITSNYNHKPKAASTGHQQEQLVDIVNFDCSFLAPMHCSSASKSFTMA